MVERRGAYIEEIQKLNDIREAMNNYINELIADNCKYREETAEAMAYLKEVIEAKGRLIHILQAEVKQLTEKAAQ